MPGEEDDEREEAVRLERDLQNNAFQTWRLAGRSDGFVRASTARALPGEVPSVLSAAAATASASGGAAATTTTSSLDFLRTQAAALRNHLTLSCGRVLTFCVAPGTPAAVACSGARVLLCEVAAAGAGAEAAVSVAADVSLEQEQQQLVGDALDASVAVIDGSESIAGGDGNGPWALVSLGRGDLRAVRLPAAAGQTPPSSSSSPLFHPLRPVSPLAGVRPFVLTAAAVLPPTDSSPTTTAARVRCVAWSVADRQPRAMTGAAGGGGGAGPSSSSHQHHHVRRSQIRHACELWSFELSLDPSSSPPSLLLVSRRRLLQSLPAAPHAVELLLPRVDAVLAAVQPRDEDDDGDDDDEDREDGEEEANDQKGEEAAAAAPTNAAAAALSGGDNNQAAAAAAAAEPGRDQADDDDDDMSPRTLQAAAAALAKFTSENLEEGAGGGGAGGGGDPFSSSSAARAWAPASDILRESGADGVGGMGDEPALELKLVPCAQRGRGSAVVQRTTWRCGPHRLLSAEQVVVVAAAAAAALSPLLLALSDDVDCAVVTASLEEAGADPESVVSVRHRATVPALAYVLAGKTQRRHLLLAPPPPPPEEGAPSSSGAVAAALVEGRRYAYLYGRVPAGATVGAQEVVDLSEATRLAAGGEEQEQPPTVLGARLVVGGATAATPPRLLVLTERSLLTFELR